MRRSRDIAVHVVTDQSAPPPERRGAAPPSPLSLAGGARRGGAFRRRRRRRRPAARPLAALAKSVDDFSRRGDLLRRALRLVVGDRGGACSPFSPSTSFSSSRSTVHDLGAAGVPRAAGVSRRRRHHRPPRRPRARTFAASMTPAHRLRARLVRIFAQGFRRRHARRRGLGGGGAGAKGARGAMRGDARARGRRIAPRRRLAAHRCAGSRGNGRGALGLRKGRARRLAHRNPAQCALPVSPAGHAARRRRRVRRSSRRRATSRFRRRTTARCRPFSIRPPSPSTARS